MAIREILVLHHSHFDRGYTHSQPIVMELHREYISQALDLLDRTADWPDHCSPKWTCEVTLPVLHWLASATDGQVERFRAHAHSGRIAVSAMSFNVTPLLNRDQLRRQLEPLPLLRQRLGLRLNTAIQHDVNGVPWPLTDILLDAGIEMLMMGINVHFGGAAQPRPGIFRWQTPSGRELPVLNGNHYTMFEQLLLVWENSLDTAREGWARYERVLQERGYPHDFICLTGTASPDLWDNSPPNPDLASFIRRWNEAGLAPSVRYVTSEDLCRRVLALPRATLPLQAGDWTDFWNFGSGSTAADVARTRRAKRMLAIAGRNPRAEALLDLYDEHTWSYWDTTPGLEPGHAQNLLKSALAVEGHELAAYALVNELERKAGNPEVWKGATHALLINPSPVAREEYVAIPRAWRKPGRQFRAQRFSWINRPDGRGDTEWCGPIALPPFGEKRIALAELPPAPTGAAPQSAGVIESPSHRLTFDPQTGRITALLDKALDWQVTPESPAYDLFAVVRERPATGLREEIYARDEVAERYHVSGWKAWNALREAATPVGAPRIEQDARGIALLRDFSLPGTTGVSQRIGLRFDSPVIELDLVISKSAEPAPEALYLVVPINLPAGWRAHFDTAGTSVELDAQQLPGCCRNWFTVDSYAALHGAGRAAALLCPDAPLAMAGGFHFGPPLASIPREANPLLLGWPLNNYWNTNFPLVQPGQIRLRYGLLTRGNFNAAEVQQMAQAFANPILAHPAGADY